MAQDNFSLKDMIIELRDEQKKHNDNAIKMSATLESMELQMKKFLAISEDHETRIQKQEGFQGKAMMVWGFVIFLLTTVANKVIASINL